MPNRLLHFLAAGCGALCCLFLIPAFAAWGPATEWNGSLAAQELRVGGALAFPGIREMGSPSGGGIGIRYFLQRGVGGALEHDRFTGSRTVSRFVCPPGHTGDPGACPQEAVRMETEMDVTTLILMAELMDGEEWGFRLGLGRSAGRIVGEGRSLESDGRADPVPADEGTGLLAWSRGADGSVFVLEVLRRLPVPGPLPLSAYLSYRFHSSEMEGCAQGEFSPFCGPLQMSELQLGLNLGLWPR